MHPKIQLRLMTSADLAFADGVRALAGWNQTLTDWRRLLAHDPDGCFVAEWDGSPAGTATTTRYGTDLAWIGMVLVHPDNRRRGIGQALLQHCLVHLQDVACVKLDATPLGKMLYEQLEFQEEWSLTRWEGVPSVPQTTSRPSEIQSESALAVEQLDRQAFGVSRHKMLDYLAGQSRLAVVRDAAGSVGGYGMLREGARARYVGPIVAASADLGEKLATRLAAQARGETIYWDIPDLNAAAVELAKRLGLAPQRHLLRMYRGENNHPGDPLRVFAIADPSTG